jgi:hypothetical protein
MLTVIFVVTVFAIVIMRDSDSVFLVFLLGVVFASLFLGFYKAPHANDSSAPVQPFASPTAADRSISPEAGRLLAALEQLEKRLVNLETIITQKEFDWERRLNQDPPPSTQPHPAPAAPGGASPVA